MIALCDITWGQCSEQLVLTQKKRPGRKLDGLFSLLWGGSGRFADRTEPRSSFKSAFKKTTRDFLFLTLNLLTLKAGQRRMQLYQGTPCNIMQNDNKSNTSVAQQRRCSGDKGRPEETAKTASTLSVTYSANSAPAVSPTPAQSYGPY